MLDLGERERFCCGPYGGGPGFERLVPRGQHAVDRPHPAGGRPGGEDRVEVRLVGRDERSIDRPRQRLAHGEPDEVDELLLCGDERSLGLGPLRPRLGGEGIEHGAVVPRGSGGDEIQPFDGRRSLLQPSACGGHFPIGLRDPQPTGAIARPLECLEQGQRTVWRGAALAASCRLEQLPEERGGLRRVGSGRCIARAGRGRRGRWIDHDRHGAIRRDLAGGGGGGRGILRAHGSMAHHEADREGHDETRARLHMGSHGYQ